MAPDPTAHDARAPEPRDPLLDELAAAWTRDDPVPDGLVARMQAAARAEVEIAATDLEYELMLLVERSTELAGARSASTAYTLRFNADGLDLMVRVAAGASGVRLDGWVIPPAPCSVRATRTDDAERTWSAEVDERGRFVFADLEPGLHRLWLTPQDGTSLPFGTPTFEL